MRHKRITRLWIVIFALLLLLVLAPAQSLIGAEAASILGDEQAITDLYNAGELLDVKLEPDRPAHVDNPRTRLEVGNNNLVWIKQLTLWTESQGQKTFTFYFDKRLMPEGLTEAQQLQFWDELRTASVDQFSFTDQHGNKDYGAYYRAYVGEPILVPTTVEVEDWDEITGEMIVRTVTTWDFENYTIQGRYNSNPGELDRDSIEGR